MDLDSIVSSIIGGSEEIYSKGTNRIIDGTDGIPLSIVSYINNLPAKVLFLSNRIGSHPHEKTIAQIKESLDSMNLENITVRLGHSSIIHDCYRLFTDERLKDISLLSRIFLGIPYTLIGGLQAKLRRSDHYNPFTRTATIYSDVPAVAAHELGHAKDFQDKKHVTLYALARTLFAPVVWYQEFVASYLAHKSLSPENKWETGRYLVPAFASYMFGPIAIPTLVVGNILYRGAKYIAKSIYSGFSSMGRGISNLFSSPTPSYSAA
ncbi:MAG: hypothetical protein V1859_00485 [archaeon]